MKIIILFKLIPHTKGVEGGVVYENK